MTTKKLCYHLAPEFEAFAEIAKQVNYELDLAEIPGRTRHACEVVIEEIVTNVIRHGGGRASCIALKIDLRGHDIVITTEDDGLPFDPTLTRCSTVEAGSLDELQVGGLGLLMVRQASSQFTYERVRGRNLVAVRVRRES